MNAVSVPAPSQATGPAAPATEVPQTLATKAVARGYRAAGRFQAWARGAWVLRRVLLAWLLPLALLGLWAASSHQGWLLPDHVLPAPGAVWQVFTGALCSGEL